MESQDVHVALAQERRVLPANLVTRPSEAVQGSPLVEDRALGRIDVLGDAFGLRSEDSPAKRDCPVSQIVDREDEPGPEAIVRLLRALAGREQAGFEQDPVVDPPRLRCLAKCSPLVRRPPETEAIEVIVLEAAIHEIATGGPAFRFVV